MPVNRDRLLEGAVGVLDTGPYDTLTIDALASALRMSKSTLYKHFESKDQLVDALVLHLCAEAERDLAASIPKGGRATEALDALFEAMARHADRMPKALLLQPERLPKGCRLRVEDTRHRYGAACLEVAERGVTSGEFAAASARTLGHALHAACEAVMVAAARSDIAGARSAAVRSLRPVFTRGILRG